MDFTAFSGRLTNQLVVHPHQEIVGSAIEPCHGRTKRARDPVYTPTKMTIPLPKDGYGALEQHRIGVDLFNVCSNSCESSDNASVKIDDQSQLGDDAWLRLLLLSCHCSAA